MTRFAAFHLLAGSLLLASCVAATPPADRVYRNATVFIADAHASMAEAVAIREGRIVYVGSNEGVASFIGPSTKVTDLQGRFLMPGLVDGHMHPLEAGLKLQSCSLDYESLTVEELQQRVQGCLDQTRRQEPDGWLEVVNWFQESMRPAGVKTSRATLDALKTSRPIIVRSSFGHTVLANSRALALANISKSTADPLGGKIWRDADGNPTGLLEDAAHAVYSDLIPKPTPAQNIAAAKAAQQALGRQGVTSFLDAVAPPEDLAAFTAVQTAGDLTVRAHFAPLITPDEASDPARAVAKVVAYSARGEIASHGVVVPEGFNMFDVAAALEQSGVCKREDFLNYVRTDVSLVSDLAPEARTLEGYLFPDTYNFSRSQTPREIAAMMVKRFRQEAAQIGLTENVQRTVTLASIVEKETSVASERPLVAGVFENRLAQHIGLATDPSVIYASLLRGKFDGTIRQSDLQLDSPYNTYKYAGLPPGPIANPGVTALQAAMHPTPTDYLYFVANNAGGHTFARTIEEHNHNVAEYRRGHVTGTPQDGGKR